MKAIDIAIKDMKQAFRSYFAIAFMFVIPILITALFAFLFGGIGEDAGMEIDPIPVQVYDQDEGDLSAIMLNVWQSEELASLLAVTIAPDEASARQAVDQQQAEVAILIPKDFSPALFASGQQTSIVLYQDPTLTLGPGIVRILVSQFTDSFSGINITLSVAETQLAAHGMTLSPEMRQSLMMAYSQAITQAVSNGNLVGVESVGGEQQDASAGVKNILGFIMGGMMVFYAFFTGANASNTILTEQESGTLERLFSTATPPSVILTGKLLAAALMILVQLTVLMLFGWLVFGIEWGSLVMIAPFILVVTIAASSFGMFAISLAKDRRQSGVIMGAGMTITGMLGMAGTFMLSSPTPNQTVDTLTLLVPQGWANRALLAIMGGLSVDRTLLSLLALLAYSAVLVAVGIYRFQRRFS
jgi:ABC-2 type transport system permease protein